MYKVFLLVWVVVLFVSASEGKTKEDLFKEGVRFSKQENYRGAFVLFKNALEEGSSDVLARLTLASTYLDSGKYHNAEKRYLKVLMQDSFNGEYIPKLAGIYTHLKKTGKANDLIERTFTVDPSGVKALEVLNRASVVKVDQETAKQMFRKRMLIYPGNSPINLDLSRIHFNQKINAETRLLLNSVISLDIVNSASCYFLAELESSEGNIVQALKHYQQLTQVNGADGAAHSRSDLLWLFNKYSEPASGGSLFAIG
ncbi:MAG TPA: tetratricopeptide repeat protein [Geopsychrobacteraceae bacterium]|nr:tetratricopeptide repeat protein [Geopsychrobacteraceae bacterium]